MPRDFLTDEQVEMEIDRLQHSEFAKLAQKEISIKLKRRKYMYTLRYQEKRGKQLANSGLTLDNIEERLGDIFDDISEGNVDGY